MLKLGAPLRFDPSHPLMYNYAAIPMKTGEIQQFVRTLVCAREITENNQTRVAGALSKRSPRMIIRPGASAEAERPRHPGRPFQDV